MSINSFAYQQQEAMCESAANCYASQKKRTCFEILLL